MPGSATDVQEFNVNLTCSDILKSMHFYTVGLGFELVDRMERDSKLRFVRMKAGTAIIGLGQDDFANGKDRSKGLGLRQKWNRAARTTSASRDY